MNNLNLISDEANFFCFLLSSNQRFFYFSTTSYFLKGFGSSYGSNVTTLRPTPFLTRVCSPNGSVANFKEVLIRIFNFHENCSVQIMNIFIIRSLLSFHYKFTFYFSSEVLRRRLRVRTSPPRMLFY